MLEPTWDHDCDECVFLGTSREAQTFLVTDEVAEALTAHIEGTASIADLNKALGVKPSVTWDLYVCKKEGPLGYSVIARYGSDPSANKSAPIKLVSSDPELGQAAKLAAQVTFHEATKP